MSRENHIYEPDWSGRTDQLCSVNKPVIKKDALALVTGKPVYVDDLAPKDCLIVKVLRSPHANAIVNDQHRDRNESSGHRGNLYLGGCAETAFYNGRTDLPGTKPV